MKLDSAARGVVSHLRVLAHAADFLSFTRNECGRLPQFLFFPYPNAQRTVFIRRCTFSVTHIRHLAISPSRMRY